MEKETRGVGWVEEELVEASDGGLVDIVVTGLCSDVVCGPAELVVISPGTGSCWLEVTGGL